MQQLNKFKILGYSSITLTISTILLIVAGEFMVRYFVPKETYYPISNIFRAVDSGYGYTFKPNFHGTAFGVSLDTNSIGFRGSEWILEKSNNTYRIAFIGDSHAFGYGVEFKNTVGNRLSLLLNKNSNSTRYEVLNFGVSGYNSQQELSVFHNVALKYNPDLIIIIPCSNDHEKALVADSNGFLRHTSQQDPKKYVRDRSINKLSIDTVSWLAQYSKLVQYSIFIWKKIVLSKETNRKLPTKIKKQYNGNWWMGRFPSEVTPTSLQVSVYQPLRTIICEAKKRKIPVVIANFNAILEYRQLFDNLSKEENIPSIELLALFPEVNNWQELLKAFGLGWNNHLNARAHKRWAIAIFKLLKEKTYIR